MANQAEEPLPYIPPPHLKLKLWRVDVIDMLHTNKDNLIELRHSYFFVAKKDAHSFGWLYKNAIRHPSTHNKHISVYEWEDVTLSDAERKL